MLLSYYIHDSLFLLCSCNSSQWTISILSCNNWYWWRAQSHSAPYPPTLFLFHWRIRNILKAYWLSRVIVASLCCLDTPVVLMVINTLYASLRIDIYIGSIHFPEASTTFFLSVSNVSLLWSYKNALCHFYLLQQSCANLL